MKPIFIFAFIIAIALFICSEAIAQVGIGTTTPNASSMLDVTSTTKGLLIPSMTKAQRIAIGSPATGLMIFQTDDTAGVYYNSGTPAAKSWRLVGNNAGQWVNNGTSIYYNGGNVGIGNNNPSYKLQVGADAMINGLTVGRGAGSGAENSAFGDHALYLNTAMGNTAVGYYTLYAHAEGNYNTAIGDRALRYDTAGSYNTASGFQSLYNNRSGISNTAMGYRSLYTNTNGDENVVGGVSAMHSNTTGSSNIAFGYRAMYSNESGHSNVAIGVRALYSNTNRSNLVAVGDSALFNNTYTTTTSNYAKYNVAIGSKALYSNTTGYQNIASGYQSQYSNTSGYANTSLGYQSLYSNAVGGGNTAVGFQALFSNEASQNTAIGSAALYQNISGTQNVAMGLSALGDNTYGNNNTAVGYAALTNHIDNDGNTAVGHSAMYSDTTGNYNTAVGVNAMYYNRDGDKNVASGYSALYNNKGDGNTATGYEALKTNTTGYINTAYGIAALHNNTIRNFLVAFGDSALFHNGEDVFESYHATKNTALGSGALRSNTFGYYNTAVGYMSLYSNEGGKSNTAIGMYASANTSSGTNNTATGVDALLENTTGVGNTAFGSYAGYYQSLLTYCTFLGRDAYSITESITNSMALGSTARVDASNQIRIGNTTVTSIGGYAGWSNVSDGRYKTDVQENVSGLDFILKLRPVNYRLDMNKLSAHLDEDRPHDREGESDSEELTYADRMSRTQKASMVYTGFIAQEVEQAALSVGFDFSGIDKSGVENGGLYSLRYAEFVVPLVKAVQEQQAMITDLKAIVAAQQKQIEELMVKTGDGKKE
jgi:trimeric autotransporter adhesin